MIREIWSNGDKLRHYWIDAPVWKTLCGDTISTPYTPADGWDRTQKWAELCLECGQGARALYAILRQDTEEL